MKSSFNAVFAVLLTFMLPHGASSAVPVSTGDEHALTAATNALCHQEVAMLGESAAHGYGHTEAFKVALVERLVNECGFDSVFFEASQYEFINISRRLRTAEPVSEDQISSAVGGYYSSGFIASGLSLNGGATIAGNALELTDGGLFEARSAFFSTALPTVSFTTDFTFQITDPVADGIAFVIQCNSS